MAPKAKRTSVNTATETATENKEANMGKKDAPNTEQTNAYLWMKALDFFKNYVNNFDNTIRDNDFFNIVTTRIGLPSFRKALKSIFVHLTKNVDDEDEVRYKTRRFKENLEEDISDAVQGLWNNEKTRDMTRQLLIKSADVIKEHYAKFLDTVDVSRKRCDELQKFLQLNDEEMDLMLQRFFIREKFLEEPTHTENLLATCNSLEDWLNVPACRIQDLCNAKGNLMRYDLLDAELDFCSFAVRNFIFGLTKEPLASRYFKRVKDETLPWEFFDEELRQSGDFLKSLIKSNAGKKPMNILLYGTPGTGKTSFAKTLAKELGVEAFLIAQDTKQGNGDGPRDRSASSGPRHRFAAVQICGMQIKPTAGMMIVDEADNMLRCAGNGFLAMLFGGGNSDMASDKGLLNSIMDKVYAPTIWITNISAEELDESSKRRFDYSIEFTPMNAYQRKNIWRNNIEKFKLNELVGDEIVERFSEDYAVSAGGISQALSNLANIKPEKDKVEENLAKLLEPHCELMHIPFRKVKEQGPVRDYSLEGLNIEGKTTPEQIIRSMENFLKNSKNDPDTPRMNLMLSGPAGSGKTEFVKHIGQVLHKKVVVKMGSDLLDCYVGNTEKRIAAAFKEAEKENAILFFDEIDGMVQSRTRARQNWEVSQVSEFLYRMENFKGIMIGASNFMENLDSAILRRFTFKFKFDYLTKEGKEHFFKALFKRDLTEEDKVRLAGIPRLTPGDYRTVRQSLFYLDGETSNADYLDALEKESNCKQDNRSADKNKIGF